MLENPGRAERRAREWGLTPRIYADYGKLLDELGYAHANNAAMADIPLEAQKAAFVDPVTTTLLAQTPVTSEFREKMIQEFENIKAGF